MRITIVTDTWNNVNGVVTTLKATVYELEQRGHHVQLVHPGMFKVVSMSKYPEIQLSWNIWRVGPILQKFNPEAIHIATEGPIGWAAKIWCDFNGLKYTTSYHTKFPEYMKIHFGIPISIGYWAMRVFHKFSHRVLVTTATVKSELESKGFKNLIVWNRGVDKSMFNSLCRCNTVATKPIILCVSRASNEKGLDDFCSLHINGTKILVGDGPYLETLKTKYHDVIFAGYKHGKNLCHYYANADVFVFPSKTDTFGVVMLEAIACGTPVVAYPVTGPIDVITCGINGELDNDLKLAISRSLLLDRKIVEESSKAFTWKSCTDVFERNIVQIQNQQTI